MTVDAVGGVWRFAMDLARTLTKINVETTFLALGPRPSEAERTEAEDIGELIHLPLPLDWLARSEAELAEVPQSIMEIARARMVDLIHLNLPTQAAGMRTDLPVVVMSHSCVPTWFQAVKGSAPPDMWHWHGPLNQRGLARADAVLAPSRSHATLMERVYGPVRNLRVVHNATAAIGHDSDRPARHGVVAVGRWWDEGKNGAVLDSLADSLEHRLTMIGSNVGPHGETLQLRHARHVGPLDHAETLKQIGSAEVFVSPSLYEPFGLAALEAARARTPLVLADIPTYRELWDGAALFAPPRDPGAYRTAIDKLTSQRQLRELFAQLASNRATRFSTARQAAAIRAVYDSLAHRALNRHVG
jgi:glycosyltransferase involved in cell wall biosynthesis